MEKGILRFRQRTRRSGVGRPTGTHLVQQDKANLVEVSGRVCGSSQSWQRENGKATPIFHFLGILSFLGCSLFYEKMVYTIKQMPQMWAFLYLSLSLLWCASAWASEPLMSIWINATASDLGGEAQGYTGEGRTISENWWKGGSPLVEACSTAEGGPQREVWNALFLCKRWAYLLFNEKCGDSGKT